MMKKILKFSKKRRGFSPSSSDAGSILSIGYEIKEKDLGKVHKAASLGDLTKLKQLAKKNDLNQLDKENRTPLHIACAYGHTDVVLFLVENKAKLNLCDNQNRSPLMKAVQCQQETCAALLLEHSADPNLVDINGNTALHLAALIPSVPMGTQLLEHGANINADNKDGCTPLILAVTENHTEMVEFLLKEGADVNAKDQGKRTSLIIAACNGQISMIRLLLANNADIAVKDEKGWTSDDYAVINGHHACSHLIIEHGTRRRCQHSPSFPGQSRQQRPVGSPGGEDEAAFSLGRPASNRDELHLAGASEAGKVDDNSQVESISRASKSAAGDSWLSSDEDDGLQLSPKKPQKVNLKKLISSSEKGRKRAAADSRSWSERESDAENDDRGERDSAPSEISPPLRGSVLPPPSPSPAPFSKPPQVPSTLLRSSRTEENSTDADCEEEEEDEDSKEEELGRVEDKVPHGEHPHDDGERNEVPVQKRDFLSELGLGDRADDDSWDSPVSESPRKLRVGINSPATPKEESAIVPEKSDEGGPCDDLQQKPGVSNAKPMHVLPTPAVTMDNTNVKIDLMEELGLGDVDDLEDPSDWDSSSSSCTSHRVIKQVSPDEPHPLASDKEPITTPPSTVVPASGGEEPATSVTEGSFENTKSALAPPNGYSPRQAQIKPQAQPRTRKTLATTGNEEETSVTEVLADDAEDLSAGPEMPQKGKDVLDKSGLGVSELYHSSPVVCETQGVQRQEDGGETDEDSDASWEKRYEKIWVETEKREVKSHYRSVTAELKEKFGELCWRDARGAFEAAASEESSRDGGGERVLVPIAEQRESGLEDSLTEPSEGLRSSQSPQPTRNVPSNEKDAACFGEEIEKEEQLGGQEEAAEHGGRERNACRDLSYSGDGCSVSTGVGDLGPEGGSQAAATAQKTNEDTEAESKCLGDVARRLSDEALEEDMQRFKYEVCEEMRELPTVQHHHPLRGVEGQRRSFVGENVKEELSERGTNSASEKEPEAKLNQGLGSKYAERFAAAGSAEVPEEMEIGDDFDDLTQSSDTGTDEADFPASGFRNASLLIQQLDSSCIDSVSMVKLQTMFHEYECTIQREKGRCSRLSDKVSQLEEERANLKQVLEETRDVKSILEHRQVDLETELKNFKFVLKQEQEKHRNACMLHDKGCEQLRVKEEQYHTEVQERQKVELAKRNLELEMRALVNSMKQLEDDHSETQRLLAHERSTRTVQEGILTKHMCKQRELEEENMRNFTKSSEAISQLSEASDREKQLVQQSQSLHEEVTALRMDLERVRAHSRQEEAHLGEENETLRERLEDARRDLKLSEEALAQTVYQYNGQISALRAECSMASAKLEHEKQAKERLEAEADSARVRLAAALQEVEVIQASRAEADRSLQREREDWQRTQEKISAELAGQRESANSLSQQLGAAEAKANSLENECHRASLSLTEKSLLLETVQREHDRGQAQIRQLEVGLQAEREQAGKAAARQEATQERLAQAQSETMLLRQQLEEAQNRGVIKERAVTDAQERFSDLLGKLRADSEERVRMAEERSKELVSKNNELQEQLLRQDLEKAEREAALRQLQQELADTLKKLSMSEASLEVNSRYRNDLEEEKLRLQKDMDRLRGRLQESEDQYVQAEQRIHELKRALDDKERDAITSSQRLQEALAAAVDRDKMVKQLEEAMQKLEIENVRLEASAKQQMNRMEVLQRDSQEAAEVRNRLEDLVTDLQGSKITLEDKLSREVQKQNLLSHSAQDTHRLWEEEMKARARLSLRLAELEREKGELSGQAEIERKRAKKTAEQKKSTDIRLDQEMSRNAELQKDISRLKVLLKTAKKRLREQQNMEPDAVLSKPGDTLGRMKSRVDELTLQLQKEEMKCTKMEALNSDLKEQLSSLKALSRTNEHLERGKRRLEEEVAGLQRQMESSRMDQNQLEHYCRDAEERARQEVRQKLEEVNLFLQTQAASQEALEQMKAANEASLRAQQEQRMRELEDEMSRLRGSQNDSLSQKESALTELQRYRELYSQELQLRKSLAAKLERSNERLGEANAKLLGERQRTRSLIAGSMGGSLIGPSLDVEQLNPAGPYGGGLASGFLDPAGTGQNTKVETFLAKMQNELEKNITRELDKASAELGRESARLSPVGSVAVSQRSLSTDQDPVARATQQYLDVLKKNYRI
ncbi:ankyrin repeat domain-containing protein 26 isoform X2 [Brienomyrus brachyistius]|uniref:ankyrin repeat domain-containing protein 26 isoform X2 n=1 Tax=Brienomyrus brachyistius TaxID=42636 RepID=UPI0020B1DA41|nr:ankyrin repeat domain-containing protein 26 isoform X2 [Brienomyrus brachyistius]